MNKTKLQIFIENLFDSLLSLIRIISGSRFFLNYYDRSDNTEECVILGNGPSLTKNLTEHRDFIKSKTTICVNHFPATEFYRTIKPSIFVTSAPELWSEHAEEQYREMGRKIFTSIADCTSWDLKLFIPHHASKSPEWQQIISKNPLVKVHYFNPTPVEGYRNFRNLLFRLNLGMPRPHNVLIPSIMLAINSGFKKIYLLGADHSWLHEITVDDDNDVLINQKHFYDEKTAVARSMHKAGRGKRRLHEVLIKFYYSFEGYHIIKDYAESRRVEIFNATKGSYIDAFERVTLEKIKMTDA